VRRENAQKAGAPGGAGGYMSGASLYRADATGAADATACGVPFTMGYYKDPLRGAP